VSNYWIANVPADGVPYWDFNAPGIPNTYKDSSAAAIAASGLLELARIAPDPIDKASYKAAAEKILTGLLSKSYFAEGSKSPGLLLHGAIWVSKNKFVDNTNIIGDYYFLQAMNRYMAT